MIGVTRWSLVDRDADVAHDVADDRDHDIGVEGTEQDGEAAGADRDAAPAACGAVSCELGITPAAW